MKNAGVQRIADRYVKALFEVASEGDAIEAVESDLASLGNAIEASDELKSFLGNPLLPEQARAQGMLEILERMKAHQATRQFIGMVLGQKRLSILPEMIEAFALRASAARGEVTAKVTSASVLNDKDIKALEKKLTDACGHTVRVTTEHNPALVAGMIINIGSQQLDASLAGKLSRLGQKLRAA